MTIAEMKQRKRELGLTNQMISEQSGIPFGTVQKIFSGGTKAPRYDTILALEKVLVSEPRIDYTIYHVIDKEKKAGEYTTDDYYALPDNCRAELIDGVLYEKAPPLGWHQVFTGMIYARLLSQFMSSRQRCFPFISPVGVQLDADERTMVNPDIVVLGDLSKFSKGRILGAPDLIIEILSKPTRKRDIGLKLYKYMEAGVREYWIVDHIARKVYQYDFEHDAAINVYDFENEVPVLISAGACFVDLAEIERFYRDAGLGPDA